MKKRLIHILTFLLSLSPTLAQNRKIDSLLAILKRTAVEDTNKVNTLNALAFCLYNAKPDSTLLLSQRAETLAEKLNWAKGKSMAYRNEGIGYWVKGDYTKAMDYLLKALKIAEEIGNIKLQMNALGSIGVVLYQQGEFSKALEYYMKSLKIADEIGNKEMQAKSLSNIGLTYTEQGDYLKALEYFLKALKIDDELGSKRGQTAVLSNIGIVYENQGDYPKALDYYLKAMKMDDELDDKPLLASDYNNIGLVYKDQGDYQKALNYFFKALKLTEYLGNKQRQVINLGNIGTTYGENGDYHNAMDYDLRALKMAKEIGDKRGIALNMGNLGTMYTKTGKFKEAETYLKSSISLDSMIGEQNDLRQMEEKLSQLYDTTGNYKYALSWFKMAMNLKDTLFNIAKDKALTRKELTYQYEKKEALQKAEQDKKDTLALADKRKQRIIVWAVISGLSLALIFAGFIFRSLRTTRKQKMIIEIKNRETEKQNALIEQQKRLVEEKNKDILDSISYARRLQDAILPPLSIIKKYLPESFVLYKPKDIVAGDFYWMEGTGDTILIAAADCTGHGVPGAMVSVVCSNALNRTVKEFKITEPGKILDKVRELVIETFEKSESEVQDGMDISLCCINTQTNEIQWSGANNPLWYTQNGELKEVASDKQPIGKFHLPKPFNTTSLKLKKGDTLYLFTDGYADQFGGPKGKKFKYQQLNDKLKMISEKSMDEQKMILVETLENWQGKLEQVDDILIIGIRV